MMDAIIAVEARHISFTAFYDCSGGSFGKLMGTMECELSYAKIIGNCFLSTYGASLTARTTDLQAAGDVGSRVSPRTAGAMTFLVNFPVFWKMCLDMVKAGSGIEIDYEILVPGTDLRKFSSVTDVVDVAMLPKAIGGDVASIDEDGKEDETYTVGVGHPTLSAFLNGFGE